jgi:hypothetical protein
MGFDTDGWVNQAGVNLARFFEDDKNLAVPRTFPKNGIQQGRRCDFRNEPRLKQDAPLLKNCRDLQ